MRSFRPAARLAHRCGLFCAADFGFTIITRRICKRDFECAKVGLQFLAGGFARSFRDQGKSALLGFDGLGCVARAVLGEGQRVEEQPEIPPARGLLLAAGSLKLLGAAAEGAPPRRGTCHHSLARPDHADRAARPRALIYLTGSRPSRAFRHAGASRSPAFSNAVLQFRRVGLARRGARE